MGHIKTIMSYGVFVEAHNNLIGLAPKGVRLGVNMVYEISKSTKLSKIHLGC